MARRLGQFQARDLQRLLGGVQAVLQVLDADAQELGRGRDVVAFLLHLDDDVLLGRGVHDRRGEARVGRREADVDDPGIGNGPQGDIVDQPFHDLLASLFGGLSRRKDRIGRVDHAQRRERLPNGKWKVRPVRESRRETGRPLQERPRARTEVVVEFGRVLQAQDVGHPLHQHGRTEDLDLVLKSRRRRVRRDRHVVQLDDLEALRVEKDPRVRGVLRLGIDGDERAERRGDEGGEDDDPFPPPERQQKLPDVERLLVGRETSGIREVLTAGPGLRPYDVPSRLERLGAHEAHAQSDATDVNSRRASRLTQDPIPARPAEGWKRDPFGQIRCPTPVRRDGFDLKGKPAINHTHDKDPHHGSAHPRPLSQISPEMASGIRINAGPDRSRPGVRPARRTGVRTARGGARRLSRRGTGCRTASGRT